MELKIKFLNWSTGLFGAMLNKKTADSLGIKTVDRISIKTLQKKPKEIFSFVNTIGNLVKDNQIAVSSETKDVLKLKNGQKVKVSFAPTPKSLVFIKKKMDGKELSEKEIFGIIKDLVNNALSEAEIALFISSMYEVGTTFKETVYLIKAYLASGEKLILNNKIIVDKHSIGGIPGNRTTPIIVSICASTGLIFPKNSSRAITSAAGTSDVIETLAPVSFSSAEIKKIIKKTNACLVWGGSLKMVPADSKMIFVEKKLGIDPKANLLASIMSKKLAVGSNFILIDIPYGKNAKVNLKEALELKRDFENLGRYFKRKIKVVLTKGDHPIGNGIGPVLEMKDVLAVLKNEDSAPVDLKEKSLLLVAEILEMTGKAKKGRGKILAKEILLSGRAFEKFKQIIEAQGGKIRDLPLAKFKKKIIAKKSGIISEINNKKINYLARVAGAPLDKAAGIYIYRNVSSKIKKGQNLIAIYSESESRLRQTVELYEKIKPIKVK
ncbi:MAG: thymidine phosphorylase [Nanoarchaeota archaeon]